MRSIPRTVIFGLVGFIGASSLSFADDPTVGRLHQAFALTVEVIHQQHVDPPARQELLLRGARQLLVQAGVQPQQELARQTSEVVGSQAERAFLEELVSQLPEKYDRSSARDHFLAGVASACRATYVPYTDYQVNMQLRENRYEGIGIQLAMNDGVVAIPKVFPKGPAARGGIQDGDILVSVDDVSIEGESLAEVVKRLRGVRGAAVSVEVKQPAGKLRQIDMVREVVPFRTVFGTDEESEELDSYWISAEKKIAYARLTQLHGSTIRDLQDVAQKLEAQRCRGLVIDLRETQPGTIRHALMLVDLLVGQGKAGVVDRASGRREHRTRAHMVLDEVPVVLLTGRQTRGVVEWAVASLKDRKRVELVGAATAGQSMLLEPFELPERLGGIQLWSGTLLRMDGRKMTQQPAPSRPPQSHLLEMRAATGGFGIQPDYLIEPTADLDRILQKAVEVLDSEA